MNEKLEYSMAQRFLRIGMETVAMIAGALLLAGAIGAAQSWWDRHFLPVFFFSHDRYVLGERLARLACGAVGVTLIFFIRPAIGRLARRMPAREFTAAAARIALAIGLAIVASELLLDRHFAFAAAERQDREEPLRQPDPKLGWVFAPARAEQTVVGGRTVAYAIDSLGYRVPNRETTVNTGLPTILFTGESIIAGYGLNWNETIPAQVGATLGVQSANMAVFGYANDQAYLRLAAELPRFRQPVAVISLFIPSLFVRNLGDDRPHLDPGLGWKPAVHRPWLSSIFRFFVPYHSDAEIEHGIQATRAVLAATAVLARKRGAICLVVDPQFGPESAAEEMLRRRILDEPGMTPGIDYVRVQLDPSWHLKGDLHPDPRAAHMIALAIAAHLEPILHHETAHGIPESMPR
jgi:hypothetical protein